MTEFEDIYERYFKDVYAFVYSLSRNDKVAEEITQETFFKALKGIESFNGQCKLHVWLCQIAKNTYFTYLDKQKRFSDEDIPEQEGVRIEELMTDKENVFRIHQALHRLEEPYKEVFTLRIFGELSFRQISQLFGKTESWARVTFHRAKQKLQTRLKEEEQ
ncbi:RNA polymerase sigma factor [Lysinibacillus sp. 3P01SB]|uniref:RNA polymerase sigma factor n=1 Tax=Lysinibacillus sp. 3P01SB TaxID=3132284 RepID=UPI0039A5405E